jgi:hypothetical protein
LSRAGDVPRLSFDPNECAATTLSRGGAATGTSTAKDRMGKSRLLLAVFAILLAVPAGVNAQPVQQAASRTGQPAVAASLVIEQFLRASNANDLETMGRLFGTQKGNVWQRDPRSETEKRMFAIASILRHDDYQIEDALIVPGRSREATQVRVRMQMGSETFLIPFTLVSVKDTWLVEQIGIEPLMGRR